MSMLVVMRLVFLVQRLLDVFNQVFKLLLVVELAHPLRLDPQRFKLFQKVPFLV